MEPNYLSVVHKEFHSGRVRNGISQSEYSLQFAQTWIELVSLVDNSNKKIQYRLIVFSIAIQSNQMDCNPD
jgi:hypothetical protein